MAASKSKVVFSLECTLTGNKGNLMPFKRAITIYEVHCLSVFFLSIKF